LATKPRSTLLPRRRLIRFQPAQRRHGAHCGAQAGFPHGESAGVVIGVYRKLQLRRNDSRSEASLPRISPQRAQIHRDDGKKGRLGSGSKPFLPASVAPVPSVVGLRLAPLAVKSERAVVSTHAPMGERVSETDRRCRLESGASEGLTASWLLLVAGCGSGGSNGTTQQPATGCVLASCVTSLLPPGAVRNAQLRSTRSTVGDPSVMRTVTVSVLANAAALSI